MATASAVPVGPVGPPISWQATPAGTATVGASLSLRFSYAAASAGTSTINASTARRPVLAAAAAGASATAATLGKAFAVQAAPAGGATLATDVTRVAANTLGANSTGTSATTAALALVRSLSTPPFITYDTGLLYDTGLEYDAPALRGSATLTAEFGPRTIHLAAAIPAPAVTIAADIVTSGAFASPAGTSTVAADMTAQRPLAAAPAGVGTVAADIVGSRLGFPQVTGFGVIAADLSIQSATLSADIPQSSTVTADMTVTPTAFPALPLDGHTLGTRSLRWVERHRRVPA